MCKEPSVPQPQQFKLSTPVDSHMSLPSDPERQGWSHSCAQSPDTLDSKLELQHSLSLIPSCLRPEPRCLDAVLTGWTGKTKREGKGDSMSMWRTWDSKNELCSMVQSPYCGVQKPHLMSSPFQGHWIRLKLRTLKDHLVEATANCLPPEAPRNIYWASGQLCDLRSQTSEDKLKRTSEPLPL